MFDDMPLMSLQVALAITTLLAVGMAGAAPLPPSINPAADATSHSPEEVGFAGRLVWDKEVSCNRTGPSPIRQRW